VSDIRFLSPRRAILLQVKWSIRKAARESVRLRPDIPTKKSYKDTGENS
jgi:hypothetical protein